MINSNTRGFYLDNSYHHKVFENGSPYRTLKIENKESNPKLSSHFTLTDNYVIGQAEGNLIIDTWIWTAGGTRLIPG